MGDSWHSIFSWLSGISPARRKKRRPPTDRNLVQRTERLEDRCLLAVSQVFLNADTSQLVIKGTPQADNVIVSYTQTGSILVRAQTGAEVVQTEFQAASVASISFTGGDGNDRFENRTSVAASALGEGGDDVLIGGNANDYLHGGIGNNQLYGGNGDDTLVGDRGNDVLYGEGGNDVLHGNDGADLLFGGIGDDKLYGGNGNDTLMGGDGRDELYGDAGDDVLYGDAGNDYLHGGIGANRLYGGNDDDILVGDNGNDLLYGEAGNDVLYGNDGTDFLFGGIGNDKLYGGNGNDTLMGGDGADELYGDAGNDLLYGDAGNDYLHGGIGDNRLYGGADDDTLTGDNGNDLLYGEAGNDVLYGNDGADLLFGGSGNDRLDGGNQDDILFGGDGSDELRGEAGNDMLYGESGNDVLYGGIGDNRLYGGSGDDTLIGDRGNDVLFGEAGHDVLYGNDGADLLFGGSGDDMLYGGNGHDILMGGDGRDELRGDAGDDVLYGEAGNDVLYGGIGDNRLYGGNDDDTLVGDNGNDLLYGEAGNDLLYGNDGADLLFGGVGDDKLFGGNGNDTLMGGDGADELLGEAGNDVLYGEGGIDQLSGGIGNDTLFGGAENDVLFGDDGDDLLHGEQGDDVLHGHGGNDLLLGGEGKDTLQGGVGHDVLVGGDGEDLLNGDAGNDVLIGGRGRDELTGASEDDLLIGGFTTYDTQPWLLRMILAEWSSSSPYSARVDKLQSALFQARLESDMTVFDDSIADSLFGHAGTDWFIQTGVMQFYSPSVHDHDAHDGGHHHTAANANMPALEGFDFINSLDKLGDIAPGERIHSKLPHPDNAMLQREHLVLFELVRYDQVTHTAITSGNWNNPSVWQNGVVPADGARVLIPMGLEVTVQGIVPQRLNTIRVDGTLRFSPTVNSELRVDTIVVSPMGRFEMGTAAQPIAAGVKARLLITDSGPINRIVDPFALGRGLVSHGVVSIYGAAVTPHAVVLGTANAGSSVLQLTTAPSGWKVGDSLVIAGTINGTAENEVRQIIGVSGTLVYLDRALQYTHAAPTNDLQVHVAHLTRNAVIESEASAVDRRGHVMFMHNRGVDIGYAGFYQLGRTNKLQPINDAVVNANWQLAAGTGTNVRARYAVHFHRTGTQGSPAIVRGSAVVDAGGWGYVNHSSSVAMIDNVAYDVKGAAFVTEVGDETGSFQNNVAIGSRGSGEAVESRLPVQDFGHQGDGFWFQGTGISVTGNVAAGNQGHGFMVFARGLREDGETRQFLSANLQDPSIAGGAPTIDVSHVPMFKFDNNTAYASDTGLAIWYHLNHAQHGQKGVFANSRLWNNTTGVDPSYSMNTVLRNLEIRHAIGLWPHTAVSTNAVTRDITYENLTIVGYNRGIDVPRTGTSIINGGYFNNLFDIIIQTAMAPNRVVQLMGNIQFPQLPAPANTWPHLDIDMWFNPAAISGRYDHVFYDDRVLLDYGPYSGRRLYYASQTANYVPFPAPLANLPSQWLGLSNLQLWPQFGKAVAGGIAPITATPVALTNGLVGPLA